MLNRIFIFVLEVCLLRRGPEGAPASTSAASAALLLNFVLLLWVFTDDGAALPILPSLQVTVVLLLATRLILAAYDRVERYSQTVFTLFATSTLVGLTLKGSLSLLGNNPDNTTTTPLVLVPLLIWTWSFVIDAHIIRRALDSSFAIGMLFAVLIFAANNLLLDLWYLPALEPANP